MSPPLSPVPRALLPVLVLSQFAGTSLWFAVNAVMPDLQRELGWPLSDLGPLTSALQLGFIAGTLVFALLAIADRFPPRRVFLCCALAGAACTVGAWAWVRDAQALMAWRLATGFFLAGIYPVGMKIAAQWYRQGLGTALGLLIGALVLGSASAHALRALGQALPWDAIMLGVAALAAAGGVLLYTCTVDAPVVAVRPSQLQWRALAVVWTDRRVRSSVLGYFGHMWELYTMWVLVPAVLATRLAEGAGLSWAAFAVLGAGALGCALGGQLARRFGSARIAFTQLAVSGLCCLAAPFMLQAPLPLFAAWLLAWSKYFCIHQSGRPSASASVAGSRSWPEGCAGQSVHGRHQGRCGSIMPGSGRLSAHPEHRLMEAFDALSLARAQFAFTISFHIIFPAFSIGLASYLAVLNALWLATGRKVYFSLFQYWKKIFAIAFGMGVVSGLVMSYQFGTNWSVFSDKTGPVLGPMMGYEVLTAFFLEAGFLGIMLFGASRVPVWVHTLATFLVAFGTTLSAFWILALNSWMQTPADHQIVDGVYHVKSWVDVIFNPSFPYRFTHKLLRRVEEK